MAGESGKDWEEYTIQESVKEADWAEKLRRRAAWITFAAAAQDSAQKNACRMATTPSGFAPTGAVAAWAAKDADAMLAELDKRDFAGGG